MDSPYFVIQYSGGGPRLRPQTRLRRRRRQPRHHERTRCLDDLDDPYVLYFGRETAGTLLAALTALDDQGEEIAFYAMPMRRKYKRLFP